MIFLLCVHTLSCAVVPSQLLGPCHMVSVRVMPVISNDEICKEVNNSRRSNCEQSE